MARISSNTLLKGLTGRIGNMSITKNGIVRSLPEKSSKPRSKEQVRNSDKFKLALDYYHKVKADPDLFNRYKKKLKKGRRIYNIIIADFMKRP